MESIWEKTVHLPKFESLRNDIRADVLVIGGGLAGLLCAYELTQAGVDCVLAEAGRLCGGVTKNTTAKLTVQHGLIYHKLLKEFGPERTRAYLEANQAALKRFRTLCRDIPCDFEERPSYVYSLDSRKELEQELAALDKLGHPAVLADKVPLPFPVAGAVRFDRQAQFNPLKFAAGLLNGLKIFEHTRVLEVKTGEAVTGGGRIRADHIVVATHFPFLNKFGCYWLKMYQSRSYVLALEGGPNLDGMYVDGSGKGLSFRNDHNLLLLGGGGHRTGKQGGGWAVLEDFTRRHYPGAQPVCRWAAQDCMTLDGAPYIGLYSPRLPRLYVVTGFNKWGMTSSIVAANLVTDLILGRDCPYQEVFSPSRSVFHPQLAVNAGESSLNLLTPTRPRCPHLGCALKYNPQEHSWDCPCHGSRFAEGGQLLDGPATGDLPHPPPKHSKA
ncbi:MAG: FAD-dependent oxidoreductase [Oscillospiraceae bacterium]|nr:FAD-dependent oxidoreductase [Oscillospiraceae bacterium]